MEEAKQELKDVVEFLRNPERFKRLGGKMPTGKYKSYMYSVLLLFHHFFAIIILYPGIVNRTFGNRTQSNSNRSISLGSVIEHNVNISSEKLMLYQLLPFVFVIVKNFEFLISFPDPL